MNGCRDIAYVYRKTTDETFDTDAVWTEVLSEVPCDVDSMPVENRYVAGNGETIILDATMYTDEMNIEQGDRIKVFYGGDTDNIGYFSAAYIDQPRRKHSEIALTKLPEGVTV